MHHTYRVCVELLDACEAGQTIDASASEDLYQSILNLEKKDKREYLLQRFGQVFATKSASVYAQFGME